MIDLSFLTEAEQESILKVLQRDADLKQVEEQRIRHLQDVADDGELKYKSGQWFYEAKSKRHRDKIHGADLVRASIRKRKKPATIELAGVMEEPEDLLEDVKPAKVEKNQSARKVSFLAPDKEKSTLMNGAASPLKQRKNPFNSKTAGLDVTDIAGDALIPTLVNGVAPVDVLPKPDPLHIYAVVNKAPKIPSVDLPDKKPEIEFPDVPKPKAVKKGTINPILSALKRSEAKSIPRPVLDVTPTIPNEDELDELKDEFKFEIPPDADIPESQFSKPDKLKQLSKSVPTLLHDEVSGSVMSVYSGDFGNVDVKGKIQFAVDYVDQLKEFHVFVSQCKDLAVGDVKKQRSDPYVKSYLLPEKAKMGKRKTAVKKKTLNPAYNEILRYKIDKETLLAQKLNVSVWHNDALGRNSFLGEVELQLDEWDWNNKQMNWYPLQPRTPAAGIGLENRGEIKLALKYVPASSSGSKSSQTGEVHIWIKDCAQLPQLRGNKINSFVKCTILPDTSRKSRQKTRTVDKTPNPSFNHTMVYDGFKEEDLKEACVELTVWDHNKLTNHFLGGLRIGLGTGKSYGTAVDWMDSSPEESTMWEKMIKSTDDWIEGVLPLRMLKIAKITK